MARFLKYFMGLLVLLFIALIIVWNILPTIISKKMSEKAGVPVSIMDIQLTPWSIRMGGLRVGNPPGSFLSNALRVDEIKIDVPLTRFFHEKIVIPEMEFNDIYLGVEINSPQDPRGNWTTIASNVQASSRGSSDTSVVIEKLVLTDLQIVLVYRQGEKRGQKQRLKKIKRLEYRNVGGGGGDPIAQITQIITDHVINDIIKDKMQNLLKDFLSPGRGGGNPFQGLFMNEAYESEIIDVKE